jgi:hypothetical protein
MMITPDAIAAALHTAPAWAKLGLTAPREALREDAAREVAHCVYEALYQPSDIETGQLPLPLG